MDALRNRITHSLYCIDKDNENLKGMRIKMTTSHSASGVSAPMGITVHGLDDTEFLMTDEDFEKNNGIFILKIQGLTTSGGTDPLDQRFGYIVFQKSSKGKNYSADEARFLWYKQEILYDYVNGVRAILWPELTDGAPVEPHMAAASWQDGQLDQIKVLTRLEHAEYYEKNYIVDNKHSGARTGREQAADLGGQYPCTKAIQKKVTLKK